MEEVKEFFAILGAVLAVFLLAIALAVLITDPRETIESGHPITPELSITVKDGKADTTFIYVEPKQQKP